MAADWAGLPPDLLRSIADKLTLLIDYVRFRAVCSNWRSSAPTTPSRLPFQLPWLMLPHHHHHRRRRGFFSLAANKVYFLYLPETANRRRSRGSSLGWLLILDECPDILLLNPLTRAKLHLPPLSAFPNVVNFSFRDIGREYTVRARNGDIFSHNLAYMRDYFVKKVVLSSSPSNQNFIALAILNQTGDLAFCKKGDQSWKFIEDAQSYGEDAIYHNGLFYAVNKFGQIAVCDVHGESPRVSLIETPTQVGGDMQYLVSSSKGFLLVTRYLDFDLNDHQIDIVYKTAQFRVYKLDLSGPNWERVTSLDDEMLFLGENSSLALSALDFPGCKGNCIYYTDDYSESDYDGISGGHDLGVYNLEDGSIEPLPCYPRNFPSPPRWPPPIWITPNPC
ncbi:F-box protein SKIP23-like [Diospyros lotus]|uniref:F-box protein SKIP23-like n=1 Tax=Diospyros lotus TaxID=55363 RepID=UPI002254A2C8|nr:F-box protein SKIP23-like [Diospyros lotus]